VPIDSRHIRAERPGEQIDLLWCEPVPMRDGVRLGAMVYRPKGPVRPLPVILEMTPYCVASYHADGVRFASEGFVYVGIDCRGHGESEGVFTPGVNDAPDLHDALDWLVAQPWCDGQVGMYGGSYSGMNQWSAYGTGHPALKTIVPSAAAMFGRSIPGGGIGTPYQHRWGVLTAERVSYTDWFGDVAYWHRVWAERYRSHRSPHTLPDEVFGKPMDWTHAFIDEPGWSPRWDALVPKPEAYAGSRVKVLSITGQYDSCLVSALHHHCRFERHANATARAESHLVIGPWDHRGVNDGDADAGSLRFGPQSRIDVMQLKLDWYRHVMQGGPKPDVLRNRVVYYVAGDEGWRHAAALEEVSAGFQTRQMAATAGPNDVFHSGWLAPDAAPTGPYEFICDPFDHAMLDIELMPRHDAVHGFGAAGGSAAALPFNSLFMTLGGEEPTSQAFATHLRGQGVVYHSSPLDSPLALAGRPRLDLHCALDGPDADLVVLLYEIRADGTSIFLSSDLMRLRYREGFDREVLARPGEPFSVRFDDFRFFARTLATHSRLRLVLRSTASLSLQKNLHSGKPVHQQEPDDARRVKVTVLHDGERRSCLHLPTASDQPSFVAAVRP
jgi:predicted acyl esterase